MVVTVGDKVFMVVGAITGVIVGDTVGATVGDTVGAMIVVTVGDNTLGVVVNDFDVEMVGEMVAGGVVPTGVVAPTPVSNAPDFNVVVGLMVPNPPSVLAVPSVAPVPPVANGVSVPLTLPFCKGDAPSFMPAPVCGTILGSSLVGAVFRKAGMVANILGAALPTLGTKPA